MTDVPEAGDLTARVKRLEDFAGELGRRTSGNENSDANRKSRRRKNNWDDSGADVPVPDSGGKLRHFLHALYDWSRDVDQTLNELESRIGTLEEKVGEGAPGVMMSRRTPPPPPPFP